MSIKSDKWIRRMAQEHGMIEPFVERQVRGEGADRVISFGVSSYGYDVRCADEFKVFTNINSATVDPKNLMKKVLSTLKAMSASSRRTRLHWRAPSNISASRATC